MKTIITIQLFLLAVCCYAQSTSTVTEVLIVPVTPQQILHRPIFKDTTLLFFSDEIEWLCEDGLDYYMSLFKVDFAKVNSCVGMMRTYKRHSKLYKGWGGTIEGIEKWTVIDHVALATFTKTESGDFIYREFQDEKMIAEKTFWVDFDIYFYVDTQWVERASDGRYEEIIRRGVNFNKK